MEYVNPADTARFVEGVRRALAARQGTGTL
jgi:hypothetical protein